eukprot:SM000006S19532  [mRNA]  locus=s6:1379534:1380539:- [translate_table: standard]
MKMSQRGGDTCQRIASASPRLVTRQRGPLARLLREGLFRSGDGRAGPRHRRRRGHLAAARGAAARAGDHRAAGLVRPAGRSGAAAASWQPHASSQLGAGQAAGTELRVELSSSRAAARDPAEPSWPGPTRSWLAGPVWCCAVRVIGQRKELDAARAEREAERALLQGEAEELRRALEQLQEAVREEAGRHRSSSDAARRLEGLLQQDRPWTSPSAGKPDGKKQPGVLMV